MAASLLLATGAMAAEIDGTVCEVSGNSATVVTANLVPAVGDKAFIFFAMPNTGDEVSVGSARVSSVAAGSIQIAVEAVTGSLAKDQRVRIISSNPTKRATQAASAQQSMVCPGAASATAPAPASPGELPLPPYGAPEPTAASTMTLQGGQRRVIASELVNVPFFLINAGDVANVNFEVRYNASIARPEGDIVKGKLIDNAMLSSNPRQSGVILAGFAQTTGVSGTGTVLNVPFRAVGKPGERTRLELVVTTINNAQGGVLKIDRIPGEITIVDKDGRLPPAAGGGSGPATGGAGSGGPVAGGSIGTGGTGAGGGIGGTGAGGGPAERAGRVEQERPADRNGNRRNGNRWNGNRRTRHGGDRTWRRGLRRRWPPDRARFALRARDVGAVDSRAPGARHG